MGGRRSTHLYHDSDMADEVDDVDARRAVRSQSPSPPPIPAPPTSSTPGVIFSSSIPYMPLHPLRNTEPGNSEEEGTAAATAGQLGNGSGDVRKQMASFGRAAAPSRSVSPEAVAVAVADGQAAAPQMPAAAEAAVPGDPVLRLYALLVLARLANHSRAVQLDAVREGAGETA